MLNRKVHFFIILLLGVMFAYPVFAQKATVKATIEPVEISIGQQAVINLEVIAPKGSQITFPVYKDTLTRGVEVLLMAKADTVYAHDVMTINQKYIVTSFDSALYHISYLPIIDDRDTIRSNDLGLKVVSPMLTDATTSYLKQQETQPSDSINVDQLGIADIKGIQKPPFVWQDYLAYILVLFLILLVIAGLIIFLCMYRKKKVKGYFFKPKIIEPPHVIALNALTYVKDEKLWQHGRDKEYYTELTDILRKYIEDRFYINAFEKTSDEIIDTLKGLTETESSCDSLKQVLKLADLVKFAKYKPLPDENDLSLVNSFLFVNQTKREVAEDEQGEDAVSSLSEKSDKDDYINWTVSDRNEKIQKKDNK